MHRADVLERLTEAVHAEGPVQILVTGDLVHVGLPVEIEAAARWLETLGPPDRVMLVPGNHDVYASDSWPAVARAWQPYLGASEDMAGDGAFPQLRRMGAGDRRFVSLIGLSSAVISPLFMAYGRIGGPQRLRLDRALADAEGFRCVLVHHPPLPGMTHRRKGLKDAAELEQVLTRRGADLVLHGHVHRNVARSGPGGCRIYGTASASSGGRDAAAYRSFDVTPTGDGWRVEMRLVSVAHTGEKAVLARDAWERPSSVVPHS